MQEPRKKNRKANLKPRRVLALTLLLAVLAAGLGFYFLAQSKVSETPVPTSRITYRTLFQRDKNQITMIRVATRAGGSYVLTAKDGELSVPGQPGFQFDDSSREQLLNACAILEVEDTVTSVGAEWQPYRKEFGLDPPAVTVTVSYATGEEKTFSLGDETPVDKKYYYELQGDPALYLAAADLMELFATDLSALHAVEQPVIHEELIDGIALTDADGKVEAAWTLSGSVSASDAAYRWRMTAPYAYPCDSDKMSTLTDSLAGLYLGSYVGPATQENLALYGLTAPQRVISVHQAAGQVSAINDQGTYAASFCPASTFTLKVGGLQGEYVNYCQVEDKIYLVSNLSLSLLSGPDPEATLTLKPADLPLESLASLTVSTPGGTVTYTLSHTQRESETGEPETDGNGAPVIDTAVKKNGEESSYDDFADKFATLQALTVSGRLPEGFAPEASPSCTLTLTRLDGTARTIECVPYDALHNALRVDGVCLHYLIQGGLEDIFTY